MPREVTGMPREVMGMPLDMMMGGYGDLLQCHAGAMHLQTIFLFDKNVFVSPCIFSHGIHRGPDSTRMRLRKPGIGGGIWLKPFYVHRTSSGSCIRMYARAKLPQSVAHPGCVRPTAHLDEHT